MKVLQSVIKPLEVHILFPKGRRTHKVGRISETQTPIKEKAVSRQHTILVNLEGDNILVVDMGSRNGTFVNGTEVKVADEVEVKPGDIVNFSSLAYRYKLIKNKAKIPVEANSKTEFL